MVRSLRSWMVLALCAHACGGSLAVDVGTSAQRETAPTEAAAEPADWPQRQKIAAGLAVARGSGEGDDAALVAAELAKFPLLALRALERQHTHVVICRGSVTDYLTELRGVQPTGWPDGMTWDNVPGTFSSFNNEVVIAVVSSEGGGYHVPVTGEGHAAYNLVLHETTHSLDWNGGERRRSINDKQFLAARDADFSSLSAYEQQDGRWGIQETYAESAARYFGGNPNDATQHPNLHAYWDGPGQTALQVWRSTTDAKPL